MPGRGAPLTLPAAAPAGRYLRPRCGAGSALRGRPLNGERAGRQDGGAEDRGRAGEEGGNPLPEDRKPPGCDLPPRAAFTVLKADGCPTKMRFARSAVTARVCRAQANPRRRSSTSPPRTAKPHDSGPHRRPAPRRAAE